MKQYAEIKAGVDGTVVSFEIDSEAVIGPGDVVAVIETNA
jgi:biotin carboxyl carrier protein